MIVYQRRAEEQKRVWEELGSRGEAPPRLAAFERDMIERMNRGHGGFYYDNEIEWEGYLPIVDSMRTWFSADTALGRLEQSECDKFVCWRRTPRGALQGVDESENLSTPDIPELTEALAYVYAAYRRRYRPTLADAMAGDRVPMNKHKGYPDHTSGYDPVAIMAHASLTASILSGENTLNEVIQALENEFGPMYATRFGRIQGTSKWVTQLDWDGDWLQPSLDRKGWWARVREVAGHSLWENIFLRRFGAWLKAIVQAQPQHGLTPASLRSSAMRLWTIARRPGNTINSADRKAFDKHVGLAWQDAWSRTLLAGVADYPGALRLAIRPDILADVHHHICRIPILIPSPNRGWSAFLLDRKTGLPSGRGDTSMVGTWTNTALVWAEARRNTGLSFEQLEAKLGVEWDYLIWGDDTVVACPEKWNVGRSETFGFPTEAEEGLLVFLARVWSPTGNQHTLLSRMYINTINREERQEPDTEEVAAIGLIARGELLRAHPAGKLFTSALEARPRTRRIYSITQSRTWKDIEEAVLARVLEKKISPRGLESVLMDIKDLNEAGIATELRDAIEDALGEGHAYEIWTKFIRNWSLPECIRVLRAKRDMDKVEVDRAAK